MLSATSKDIFLDALELPAERRDAFVADACHGNPSLLAEVRGLLASHGEVGGFLNAPAQVDPTWLADGATADSSRRAPRASAARDEAPGDRLGEDGRFELARVLGEGGFGIVYLAQQHHPVQRPVALKVIKRGMDTRHVVARFEAERQVLARMDHPNIAKVFDAGETDAGRPYFVMEYVAGSTTIAQYCVQHRLPLRQRLELMEQVCLAVQHAHSKGVIHRDLKPANVLVSDVDGRPEPKVIDFGVAKAVDPAAAGAAGESAGGPALTQEFQIIGTPQYMSPEQATGGGGAGGIDTRSDVYSLGAILYELVAGVPPFDSNTLRSASLDELCRIIREQTPVRPSLRRAAGPAAEPSGGSRLAEAEVDWIVMKALEKEPARRYQSAAELSADLRRHLDGAAVLAGPPSAVYQLRKLARRYRLQLAAASVVIVALLATAVVSTVMATRARAAERAALEQAGRAERELSRANALADFTGDILTGIDPAVARGRDTTLLSEILADAAERVPQKLGDQPMIEASIRSMIGAAYLDIGRLNEAIVELQRSHALAVASPEMSRGDVLRIATNLANALIEVDRFEEAAALLKSTLDTRGRLPDNASREEARVTLAAMTNLATAYLNRGRNADARALFAQVLDARIRTQGDRDPLTILEMSNLATAMRRMGEVDPARELWEKSLALHRETLGIDHPQTQVVMNNLATAYDSVDRDDEAEALFREALEAKRRVFGPGHPNTIRSISNLGGFLERAGKVEEAEKLILEALELSKQALGEDDEQTLHINLRLAALLRRERRYDEAVALMERTHLGFLKSMGPTHGDTALGYTIRLTTLAEAGRFEEGVGVMREHEPPIDAVDDPEMCCSIHVAAARVLLGAGQAEQAAERIAQAEATPNADRFTANLRQRMAELRKSVDEARGGAAAGVPATAPATQP